ncbi:MAG: phosphatidylglycerophosphatase A [Paracoccus denitrificans]|nr:MAG: phosphatidylglycerophosphatase A [Paracoccus denitrificans]PZO83187.1 MAG: phosphatidylglycerophosphatase A [Paracoccus denitrificans]
MDRVLATWFGVGYLRPASGTIASAVAVLIGYGLHRLGHFPLLLVATALVAALGFWAVPKYLHEDPTSDPSEVVIDEVAGQWIALCFPSFGFWIMGLPASLFPAPGWIAAFVFFRLFDIWKPWLVGRADRRHDAPGVMLDDLWAGLFAGIATMVAAGIAHGFLM